LVSTEWTLAEAVGFDGLMELCEMWEKVGLPAAAWATAISIDKMAAFASWKTV